MPMTSSSVLLAVILTLPHLHRRFVRMLEQLVESVTSKHLDGYLHWCTVELFVPRSLIASMCPRAFCSSGPTSWNTLPARLRHSSLTLEQFKCLLKASLFAWLSPHAPWWQFSVICAFWSVCLLTMAVSCIVFEIASYWSKIAIFHTPLHSTPLLEGFPSEYCHNVWYYKN